MLYYRHNKLPARSASFYSGTGDVNVVNQSGGMRRATLSSSCLAVPMNMLRSTFSEDVATKSSIPRLCIAFSICAEEIFPHLRVRGKGAICHWGPESNQGGIVR